MGWTTSKRNGVRVTLGVVRSFCDFVCGVVGT